MLPFHSGQTWVLTLSTYTHQFHEGHVSILSGSQKRMKILWIKQWKGHKPASGELRMKLQFRIKCLWPHTFQKELFYLNSLDPWFPFLILPHKAYLAVHLEHSEWFSRQAVRMKEKKCWGNPSTYPYHIVAISSFPLGLPFHGIFNISRCIKLSALAIPKVAYHPQHRQTVQHWDHVRDKPWSPPLYLGKVSLLPNNRSKVGG